MIVSEGDETCSRMRRVESMSGHFCCRQGEQSRAEQSRRSIKWLVDAGSTVGIGSHQTQGTCTEYLGLHWSMGPSAEAAGQVWVGAR